MKERQSGSADVAPTKRQGKYTRTCVFWRKRERPGRGLGLLHIHTGLKSGPWEEEANEREKRRAAGRNARSGSPIIHDTRERGETVVCLDGARETRGGSPILLFALSPSADKIRFRHPALRLPQATRKKKKKEDRGYRRG
ncbi:hypothetical protein K0M31_014246 [Melipona bicolor]|uniref:Uncharacterized protein n=1 Tax=Melipona bicolor TaxID=60889 RepID=A0AA40G867_9HYME|nr:hypothetical protein K0M31_014246 [Melipona bicolor]